MAFQSIKISTCSRGKKTQTHLVAHPVGAPVIQPEGGNLIEVSFKIYYFPQLLLELWQLAAQWRMRLIKDQKNSSRVIMRFILITTLFNHTSYIIRRNLVLVHSQGLKGLKRLNFFWFDSDPNSTFLNSWNYLFSNAQS